jgi:hypothetical protein
MANIFDDKLFTKGFKNDETPLDEYNLNLLKDGIITNHNEVSALTANLENEINIRNELNKYITGLPVVERTGGVYADNNTLLREAITTESNNRQKDHKELNKAIWGQDEIPSDKTQTLESELKELDKKTNQKIWGTDNPPESGETIKSQLQTMNEILDKLIDRNVLVSTPSVSFKSASYDGKDYSNPHYAEVGTTLHLPNVYLNLNQGQYKYGPNTNIKLTSIGVYDGDTDDLIHEDTYTGESYNSISIPKSLTIEEKTYSYKFKCDHSDGSMPLTNIGTEEPSKQIKASTIETSTDAFKIIGYYEGCYYGGTESDSINQSTVGNLTKTGRPYGAKTLTFNVNPRATSVVVACPIDKTGLIKVYNKTVNAWMTSLFVKNTNTMTLNNKVYNVWVYTPESPYTQEATLEITLG